MERLFNMLLSNKDHIVRQRKRRTNEFDDLKKHTDIPPVIVQGMEYLHGIQHMCDTLQTSVHMIENFTSMNSNEDNPIIKEQDREMSELKELEEKFNSLLSQYAIVYKSYSEQIQRSIQSEGNAYNGTTIKTPNGNRYYVNNYGVARMWNDETFTHKNPSCSDSITEIATNDIQSLGLTVGEPMGVNEPCGYDGRNIRVEKTTVTPKYLGCYANTKSGVGLDKEYQSGMTLSDCSEKAANDGYTYIGYHDDVCYGGNTFVNDGEDEAKCGSSGDHRIGSSIYNAIYDITENTVLTNEYGYVDENNVLKQYPSGKVEDSTGTCPSESSLVSQTLWNSFKKGSNMSNTTLCNLGKVDLKDKMELTTINKQLLETANVMYEKVNAMKEKYHKYNALSNSQEAELEKQLDKYKHMYYKVQHISHNDPTVNALFDDVNMSYKSSHLKFIVWSLITGLLILYAIKHVRK